MKRILVAFALLLAVVLVFTACDMIPGNEPKDDVIEVIDGYVVVNGVKTDIKADDGTCDHTPEPDVIEVVDGYLVVNGEKTEYKVHTEPTITVIDGYVAVNGVKTEYRVDTTDVIEVVDGYLVVNGEKTEHKVYAEPTITVIDGYVAVNGVKTEYKVSTDCEHAWETVTTDPTCTTEGYDTMTCPLCDKVVRTNKTEKLDHDYATTYTIDNDYHWYKCNGCNAVDGKELHNLDDAGVCTVCDLPTVSTPGVIYDLSEDKSYAVVVGYTGTATKVKIAEEYNGVLVTMIYNSAFHDNDTITSVVISNSVTSIGDSAFSSCSSLTSVVIGDSVTSIGDFAFADCDSLTSIIIPDSVTSIGDFAFADCDSLTSIVIPNSVTIIGYNAFYGCHPSIYNEYEFGRYVGSVDNPYLALVEITNKNMSAYTIHDDTKVIGESVFEGCSRLSSITIPDSVTSIGGYAFSSCSSLTSVVIGDSVTSIGYRSFFDCSSLTSVVIPDSVTNIGVWAFYGCSGLTSIVIPDSVTSIGAYAFDSCSSLTDVYYTGSEEEWAEISIGDYNYDLTNVTIHYNYIPEE